MNLEDRLRKLEALGGRARRRTQKIPRYVDEFLDTLEDHHTREAGLPVEERPYTEEDLDDDLNTLNETIPAYRTEPGWQAQTAIAFLDEWERDVKARIKGTRHDDQG